MAAGGAVAGTRIDCPCGYSFMKDGNKPIKCPKETRIKELESAMQESVDYHENLGWGYNIKIIDKFKQLLENK